MNTIFTVDFGALPDGPLYSNHPRPDVHWARAAILGVETDNQFTFTSPVISGAAVKQVVGDATHNSVTAFLRSISDNYLPAYPGFVPSWNPGATYADTGEIVITFTLPEKSEYSSSGMYDTSIEFGCNSGEAGTSAHQPGFYIGFDSYIEAPFMKCRAISSVTPVTIGPSTSDSNLVFGGAVNTAKISWDRSTTKWFINGSQVHIYSGYDRSSRYPFFTVRGLARVLTVSASTMTDIAPILSSVFWRNLKNAVEDI